jgi:hypothetical protein
MNIKTRLQKLEQQKKQPHREDWIIPIVDYRAGIVPEVPDPPNAIPIKFVEYEQGRKTAEEQ